MSDHQPLVVTAHLANGLVQLDPWSPALDALLAYWWLREALGEEAFALGMTGSREQVDAELPLARDRDDATGLWWWRCSSPVLDPVARFHSHTHRRFDEVAASERVPGTVRTVLTAGGPYKTYRNQQPRVVTPAVTWEAEGDAAEVARLLRRCANIGRGHTHGYGAVRRWEVVARDDPEVARRARFARPLPVAFAAAHGIEGPRAVWGVRPPGRNPAHQTLCVLPVVDA